MMFIPRFQFYRADYRPGKWVHGEHYWNRRCGWVVLSPYGRGLLFLWRDPGA